MSIKCNLQSLASESGMISDQLSTKSPFYSASTVKMLMVSVLLTLTSPATQLSFIFLQFLSRKQHFFQRKKINKN